MKNYPKISKTLYKDFLKEYLDLKLYETEYGFVTYLYEKDYLYIEDMFISKKVRRKGLGRAIVNKLCIKAKKLGYKKMKAAVNPKSPNYKEQKNALLTYGMQFIKKNEEYEYYIKEI